jgi:hypothetical protein
MSVATFRGQVNIVWDDGAVTIFEMGNVKGAVVHLGQQVAIGALTIAADPQSWLETVKQSHRGLTITITYEDSVNGNYTNANGQPFQVQQLFSIAG